MVTTNAMRILKKAKIEFRTVEYEVDEEHLDGKHVADQTGVPYEQIFKTLVARGEKKGIVVFCVQVDKELNLKQAAVLIKDKKIEMISVKDLLPLTGYIRGGCSPVGMKKSYPVYIDETAENFEEIYISAGVRGAQIVINPADLISFLRAEKIAMSK